MQQVPLTLRNVQRMKRRLQAVSPPATCPAHHPTPLPVEPCMVLAMTAVGW